MDGRACVVDAGGTPVALVVANGKYYAFSNVCRHRGGPIGEGEVDAGEGTVICPWHGWQYDLNTGTARLNPLAKLQVFKVAVVGDEVRVTV